MYHDRRDASKVALLALVELMNGSGMTLLDIQWTTPHQVARRESDVCASISNGWLRRCSDGRLTSVFELVIVSGSFRSSECHEQSCRPLFRGFEPVTSQWSRRWVGGSSFT